MSPVACRARLARFGVLTRETPGHETNRLSAAEGGRHLPVVPVASQLSPRRSETVSSLSAPRVEVPPEPSPKAPPASRRRPPDACERRSEGGPPVGPRCGCSSCSAQLVDLPLPRSATWTRLSGETAPFDFWNPTGLCAAVSAARPTSGVNQTLGPQRIEAPAPSFGQRRRDPCPMTVVRIPPADMGRPISSRPSSSFPPKRRSSDAAQT